MLVYKIDILLDSQRNRGENVIVYILIFFYMLIYTKKNTQKFRFNIVNYNESENGLKGGIFLF